MESSQVHKLETAAESVSQLFTAVGKEMTPLEVSLWLRAITQLGPDATLAFVESWMSGAGQGEYRRAPTIEEFRRRADPNHVSAQDALEILRSAVSHWGPYACPPINDPRLKATITILGGWPKVCEDMPDPSQDFPTRRFAERFASAWVQAEGRVMRGESFDAPLVGLSRSRSVALPMAEAPPMLRQDAA